MINIIGKRYIFFLFSVLVIVPGLILLAVMSRQGKLPLSIDFTGGSLLEIRFKGDAPTDLEITNVYLDLGVEDVKVQTTSEGTFVVRTPALEEKTRAAVVETLAEKLNSEVTVLRYEYVGPTIGAEVTKRAVQAVAVAAFIVTVYMTFAFRGVPHALRFGICAIFAMIHDVAVVLSLTAIGSKLWGWSIDSLFLTALLTVIGFSVQDKVVVFDRIRENTGIFRRLNFETLVNHSVVQTLQRSINTQLMTVEFLLLALALFGGITLREFATIMMVGLLSGTYSSIFIAAPILVVWENQEWKDWFKRGPKEGSAAA